MRTFIAILALFALATLANTQSISGGSGWIKCKSTETLNNRKDYPRCCHYQSRRLQAMQPTVRINICVKQVRGTCAQFPGRVANNTTGYLRCCKKTGNTNVCIVAK